MNLTEKNLREKKFHNELQSRPKGRFENIFYKALHNLSDDFFRNLKLICKNAEVLDYGCGTGGSIRKVSEFNPKKITGIDISEVSIDKAKSSLDNLKVNSELFVENCKKTKFEDSKFDIVYGTGILHHLQTLRVSMKFLDFKTRWKNVIYRARTNPIINIYRKLTPNSRSKDEHPLLNRDFEFMREKFSSIKIKYYGFLTLIFFPFYNNPEKSSFYNFLQNADQYLFKIGLFRKLAWSVLIMAEKN